MTVSSRGQGRISTSRSICRILFRSFTYFVRLFDRVGLFGPRSDAESSGTVLEVTNIGT